MKKNPVKPSLRVMGFCFLLVIGALAVVPLVTSTQAMAPKEGDLSFSAKSHPDVTTTPSATPHQGAMVDMFTGSMPNDLWGYGKLNALGAVVNVTSPGFKIYLPIVIKNYVPGVPTPTATATQPVATPTPTATGTPTATPTPTATATQPVATPTDTPTATATPILLCEEYIENGDFEAGRITEPWVESSGGGYDIVTHESDLPGGITPYSDSWCALLGGYDGADDKLYQAIAVPSDAQMAQLTFYYLITSDEGTDSAHDHLYVQLRDADGQLLEGIYGVDNISPRGIWYEVTVTGDNFEIYAGQTVQVCFNAVTDDLNPTSFFIDDVSLGICVE